MMRSFVSADIFQAIDQLIYILGNWLVMMVISTNQVAKLYQPSTWRIPGLQAISHHLIALQWDRAVYIFLMKDLPD